MNIDTHNRYANTSKKLITLTHAGREQLQQYADEHDLSFSATIETLALIGMEADLTQLIVPLLQDVVQAGLKRHFNRLAKLTVIAAAEATTATDLASMLVLQTVRREAISHPQDFEERLKVSYRPEDRQEARMREMHQRMRRQARKRQKKLLKQPLTELLADYTAELEKEAADGETK